MKRGLFMRPEAESDLRDAYRWYEEQRSGLGDDFLEWVEAALLEIQANPQQFPVIHKEVRRALVRRFPYAVFYVPFSQTVTVLAVFHCRRDPGTWRIRLSGEK